MKSSQRPLVSLLFATVFSLWANIANATPILVGSTTDAQGLLGLQINGALYDVEFFGSGSYADAYGTDQPLLSGNRNGAIDATQQIASALQVFNVTGLAGVLNTYSPHYLFVAYSSAVRFAYVGQSFNDSVVWSSYGTYSTSRTTYWSNTSYALITPTAVLEPSTGLMMLLGAFGLVALRKRAAV